jgi:iron complex transport system substrate-binding protein
LLRKLFTVVLVLGAIYTRAEAQPRRIISTAPSITETLFALGVGNRVVGDTIYCRYPPEAQKITKIGTWMQLDTERILSLKPDLVIVQKTAMQTSSTIAKLGLKMLEVKFDSIADIHDTVERIAAAVGVPERGRELHRSLEQQLATMRDRVSQAPRTRVLFLVGRTPGTLDAMIAAGPRTYIDEAITAAGGRNIFESAAMSYAKISPEEVIARDPQVIIDASHGADSPSMSDAERNSQIRLWQRYRAVSAVKSNRVIPVASEIFLVPGPRVVDLVRELLKLLHPEAAR